jgi:hypothetical protein
MTYDEIMLLTNIEERDEKLRDFYINTVNVNDWLIDKTKHKKIRFVDRIEYFVNGKRHNLIGPAINFNDPQKDVYYINNTMIEKNEWTLKSKIILRKHKIRTIIKNNESLEKDI